MQHIVITGGNKGIGLALVQQQLALGNQVTVLCRNTSEALEQSGAKVHSGVELSDLKQIQQLASTFPAKSIDVLINNAGIFSNETLDDFDTERMQLQFQVDALAPLTLSQTLLPALKDGAKIAMITSRMGSISDNGSGAYYGYRMAKAALNAGSVSLARDLVPRNIHVGIYHPGFVQTQMVGFAGDISPDEAASRIIQRISELNASRSGKFYHSNGSELPW